MFSGGGRGAKPLPNSPRPSVPSSLSVPREGGGEDPLTPGRKN